MGLSLMVRLSKWSLLGLISYNLGDFVTVIASLAGPALEEGQEMRRPRAQLI